MEQVKELFADERPEGHKAVGVSGKRTDIDGHVTGRTRYYADRTFPGDAASQDGAEPASSRKDSIG